MGADDVTVVTNPLNEGTEDLNDEHIDVAPDHVHSDIGALLT